MAIMRMQFAAPITKVEHKDVAGTPLAEVSICKKNRAKEGQETTFSWLRISIWGAPAWMQGKLLKGAMIAGSGEYMLRSYVTADGEKRQSAEVNCQSFDVEISAAPAEAEAGASPGPGPGITVRTIKAPIAMPANDVDETIPF